MRLRKYNSSVGSVIMVVIFSTAMLLTFIVTTFTRVSSELTSVSRQGDIYRAFQLAEAGLDAQLIQLAGVAADQVPVKIAQTVVPVAGPTLGDINSSYTYQYLDAFDSSTVGGVRLRVTGTYKNTTSQTIEAGIQVGGSGASCTNYIHPLLNYAASGKTINMDGNAVVGNAFNNQAKLYAAGPVDSTGLFAASGSNQIWASEVSFYNPSNLPMATICPNCNNPGIFHTPVTFNTAAPSVNTLTLDLRPYYNQAVAEGHVITSSQTYTNQALSGVYYVECGLNITFKGNSSLRGTLVHEGCNGDIKIAANGTLVIDSFSGTQFDKGAAILGMPNIQFGGTTTIDISGIVMHHGGASVFAPTGSIKGSFISVLGSNAGTTFLANYPDFVSGPGPGSYPKLDFQLDRIHIGGSANVIFDAQAIQIKGDVPPDSCSGSSGAPTILYWRRL